MNKKSIISYLFNRRNSENHGKKSLKVEIKYTEMDKVFILKAIGEAKQEWEAAKACFEFVNEGKMIDYAIYTEEAAKARYIYLLLEARKMGIKVEIENSLQKTVQA